MLVEEARALGQVTQVPGGVELTGEPGLYGEFLADAQGEDVVAGIRTPEPLEAMRTHMPEAFDELLETMRRLEAHYDVLYTRKNGAVAHEMTGATMYGSSTALAG